MNAARLLAIGAIVCLAASFAAADDKKADNAKLIVGKWEVTKADEGTVGVGAVVEFSKDGKMKVTGGDMTIEGTHKVTGDKVTISFTGTIDGAPFEGGSGEDIAVLIGSNSFIPGFEDQLIGIKVGENRTIKAPFPQNYSKAELAGKEAAFDVTAKSIDAPGALDINDDFAKQLGMESLAKLRDAVKERIVREHAGASRNRLKRQLLDALDERHKFDLPPTLVAQEFENVWHFIETLSLVSGRHTLKFGAEFKPIVNFSILQPPTPRGRFSFGGNFTRDPNNRSTSGLGFAYYGIGRG